MRHLDLFSGIGGFSIASDVVFPGIEHEFVEYDPFCQEVLKKHWPNSTIHGDIRQFIADTERSGRNDGLPQRTGAWKGWGRKRRNPFLVTGGFPCQPFSAAGRRKGTADNRYLWPEMFRVIQLTKPTWVIAENVYGLITWNDGMVLEQTCSDLESEGYEVQPFIIPAVAVNAPHKRDRVWIVAHRRGKKPWWIPGSTWEAIPKARHGGINATDSGGIGLEAARSEQQPAGFGREGWHRPWTEVAAELCSVADGLPARLGKITISPANHRKEQLKAYGNAIVPQVAIEIMRNLIK